MEFNTSPRLRPTLLIGYGLLLVTLSYLCRTFVAEIFQVPSNSMRSTLFPGDLVLIAKWESVTLNDVIVFQNPMDSSKVLIKRCVALPGQELQVVSDMLIVNGLIQKKYQNLRFYFDISAGRADLELFFKNKKWLENEDYEISSLGRDRYRINCDEVIGDQLKNFRTIKYLTRSRIDTKLPVRSFYYEMGKGSWSADHMGVIFLPKKGQIIQLNDTTYQRYKDIINTYENVKIRKANHVILINQEPLRTYAFKNNYYFFMGDNRQKSEDSRMFGPVPESRIIGKTLLILCNTVRTDRFFQSLSNH
jgi:signal peptidase I